MKTLSCKTHGFSLLELLIVVAIIALLGSVGAGYYRGFVKNVEVESVSKILAGDLRLMRSKSMAGEEQASWGVHLVNTSNGAQYYELFSTPADYPSATIVSTITLPVGIVFSDPISGSSKDVIFTKISGTTTPATISTVSEGVTKNITISSIGAIY